MIFGSTTAQNLSASVKGGIGIAYVDANLWIPIMGPQAEIAIDIASKDGNFPWEALPLSIGFDLSYAYATNIGEERYGRSLQGKYFTWGTHIGYSVEKLYGQVGVVFTNSTLSGSGPFFDPDVDDAVGIKIAVGYELDPRLMLQGSVQRYGSDLDGFTSEFSRHDKTWMYALTCNYQLQSKW